MSLATLCLFLAAPGAAAVPQAPAGPRAGLAAVDCSRLADPKLDGGGVRLRLLVSPAGRQTTLRLRVVRNGAALRTVYQTVTGAADPLELFWDGRTDAGLWADTGPCELVVKDLGSGDRLAFPVDIVRLGIRSLRAESTGPTGEWQMVYFKKGSNRTFYATPAFHEYLSIAEDDETSDLDFDDGRPRPPVALHRDTAEPVMDGDRYETCSFNYPLCYLAGQRPVFEVGFGASATSATGRPMTTGLPVAGIELRCVVRGDDGDIDWSSVVHASVTGQPLLVGPRLPQHAGRTDLIYRWSWQCRPEGGSDWEDLQGSFDTEHRFYTLIGPPQFAGGVTGTQYTGPWVEVADYLATWSGGLGFATDSQAGVVQSLVRGFQGQEGPFPLSIEGVVYDTYTHGGDGGASHYFSSSAHRINLSGLLDAHASGKYVNCSDCAGATSGMLAMLGVSDVQMLRLGSMNLNCIWGIGTTGYTMNLWGSGHSFSYHHIITRDQGTHVSDACMRLDEDGSPRLTPGIPGHNHDRPWDGVDGYDALSSTNHPSRTYQDLPKLQ
ncbi:MAG: hypothetical protein H8E31_16245 [Planctomycetes bacterium]|nr:hypothetical protein [Planctomycetota bacterium]